MFLLLGTGRRQALCGIGALLLSQLSVASASEAGASAPLARIRIDLTPDQSKYDPSDETLRAAANLLQKALNAEDVAVSNIR